MQELSDIFVPGDLVKWAPDVAQREHNIVETKDLLGIVLEQNKGSKIVRVIFLDNYTPMWCFHRHLIKVS